MEADSGASCERIALASWFNFPVEDHCAGGGALARRAPPLGVRAM